MSRPTKHDLKQSTEVQVRIKDDTPRTFDIFVENDYAYKASLMCIPYLPTVELAAYVGTRELMTKEQKTTLDSFGLVPYPELARLLVDKTPADQTLCEGVAEFVKDAREMVENPLFSQEVSSELVQVTQVDCSQVAAQPEDKEWAQTYFCKNETVSFTKEDGSQLSLLQTLAALNVGKAFRTQISENTAKEAVAQHYFPHCKLTPNATSLRLSSLSGGCVDPDLGVAFGKLLDSLTPPKEGENNA